ncbi:hypothetical protein HNP24_002011 [Chryseobacterium sediminis]|uniref:Transposase n=1 Tax=Chryseobacterium sediminis TaxID=1679494 RepID=A0ABR6PZB5_9FLAO|nr:hypothetical protein [Chryseobacterium sediminis]
MTLQQKKMPDTFVSSNMAILIVENIKKRKGAIYLLYHVY